MKTTKFKSMSIEVDRTIEERVFWGKLTPKRFKIFKSQENHTRTKCHHIRDCCGCAFESETVLSWKKYGQNYSIKLTKTTLYNV